LLLNTRGTISLLQDLAYHQSQELAIKNCWVTEAPYLSADRLSASPSLRHRQQKDIGEGCYAGILLSEYSPGEQNRKFSKSKNLYGLFVSQRQILDYKFWAVNIGNCLPH